MRIGGDREGLVLSLHWASPFNLRDPGKGQGGRASISTSIGPRGTYSLRSRRGLPCIVSKSRSFSDILSQGLQCAGVSETLLGCNRKNCSCRETCPAFVDTGVPWWIWDVLRLVFTPEPSCVNQAAAPPACSLERTRRPGRPEKSHRSWPKEKCPN